MNGNNFKANDSAGRNALRLLNDYDLVAGLSRTSPGSQARREPARTDVILSYPSQATTPIKVTAAAAVDSTIVSLANASPRP